MPARAVSFANGCALVICHLLLHAPGVGLVASCAPFSWVWTAQNLIRSGLSPALCACCIVLPGPSYVKTLCCAIMYTIAAFSLLAVVAHVPVVGAWGTLGHQTVGYIAQNFVADESESICRWIVCRGLDADSPGAQRKHGRKASLVSSLLHSKHRKRRM